MLAIVAVNVVQVELNKLFAYRMRHPRESPEK